MALNFAPAKVHIATNSPDGKTASFMAPIEHPVQPLGPTHQVTYIYATPPAPFTVASNADLDHYAKTSEARPLAVFPGEGASGCVILDFAPAPEGEQRPFIHKTTTVDYVVVLEGTVECELPGGEKKLLQKGEVVIQRSCWHSLVNASTTEGARLLAVAVGEKGAVHGAIEVMGGGPGGPGGPPGTGPGH